MKPAWPWPDKPPVRRSLQAYPCVRAARGFHHLDMISGHVGGCWAGLDIVYGNPARGEIDRDTADERSYSTLCHRIDATAGKCGPDGSIAADGDNPPALCEMRRRRLDRDEDAANIRRHHTVEVLKGKRVHRAAYQNAGIDDQNVETAEARNRLRHGVPDRFGIGAVGLDRDHRNPPAPAPHGAVSAAFSGDLA